MRRSIDAADVVAALGGVLLFVAVSLEWFGDASGWEVFESLDLVLIVLAIAAVAAASSGLGATTPVGPRALLPVGLAALVIVAAQLLVPPPAAPDDQPDTGAWMALAGAALVAAAGVLRSASISVTVDVGGRDPRRRVPAVDRREGAAAAPPAATPSGDASPPPEPPERDPQATQPFKPVDGGP